MNFPSKLLEDAVNEFAKLPGIGKKTALRLALYLMKQDEDVAKGFSETIFKMRKEVRYCKQCYNLSDTEICGICNNSARNRSTICVVESIRDVIAIESTGTFNGLFHVLGGVISPVDGIGPEQLYIAPLIDRCKNDGVSELIMGLSPTMEGDTTIFYISKQLLGTEVKVTTIARGIAFGGELEYTDEQTLARSIATRMPYENYLVK